jgi:hypothetical protein
MDEFAVDTVGLGARNADKGKHRGRSSGVAGVQELQNRSRVKGSLH